MPSIPASRLVLLALLLGCTTPEQQPEPDGGEDPTAPLAPTQVVAVGGDAKATVSWTAPAGNGGSAITGYQVTSAPGGLHASTAGATSVEVSGLLNGTSYTFTVTASNAVGSSPASAPSNAVTPQRTPTVPLAPTAVSATAGDGAATLSWSAPADDGDSPITGYTVRSSPGDHSVSTSGELGATLSGLDNGTAYTFTVVATNAVGTGPASAPSDPVTPQRTPTVPLAPTAVGASAGDGQATVSWSAPADDGGSPITGYTVRSSPGNLSVSTSGALSATLTGLDNGTPYTFTVVATNAIGTGAASAPSNEVTPQVVVPATAPGAPTGVVATAGNTSAQVSWAAPAADGGAPITGYTVTSDPGGFSATTQGALSVQVTGLLNGTAYTFTVTATNSVGTGPASSASNAITPRGVPSAPTGVTATSGDAEATVSWTAPTSDGGSPILGYRISRAGSAPTEVAADVTSVQITGLTNGTNYSFTVVAFNAIGPGATSAASNVVRPVGAPAAPLDVSATPRSSGARVTWTAPSNGGSALTGYTVTSTPDNVTVTVSGTTTAATVNGLTNGVSYTFTVRATNSVGSSAESAPSNAVIPSNPPGAPTGLVAVPGNALVNLTWTAPASDGGNPILRYEVYSSNPFTVAFTGPTSATVTGVLIDVNYTFQVAAVNAVGSGPASAASEVVRTYSVPSSPGSVRAYPGDASATVTWNAASPRGRTVTGYTVTSVPGGLTASTSGLEVVVPGLTNGTRYTFRVVATNEAGDGVAGTSNEILVAAPPGAPTAVVATALDYGATLSWSPPANNGGAPVNRYELRARPGNHTALVVGASTGTLRGLGAGTAYTFTVSALNQAGVGPESAPSTPVTPTGTSCSGVPLFVSPPVIQTGRVNRIAHGDLNGDGLLDVVTSDDTDKTVTVALGRGGGAFQRPVRLTFAQAVQGVAVGNLDGQGGADIAAVAGGVLYTVSGNLDGTLGTPVAQPGGMGAHLAIVDLNGDGALDVLGGGGDGLVVSLNDGTGAFPSAQGFTLETQSFHDLGVSGIALADFNLDGHLDVASANSQQRNISLVLGTGTGSFGAPVYLGFGTSPPRIRSVAALDATADGTLDLVAVSGSTNQTFVLAGNGNGTFQAPVSQLHTEAPGALAAGDFNNDGAADYAFLTSVGEVQVKLTGVSGLRTFEGARAGPLAVADVTGDGALDLLMGSPDTGYTGVTWGQVSILPGVGDGNFARGVRRAMPNGYVGGTGVGDLDADGKLDLVAGSSTNALDYVFLKGSGDGTFANPVWRNVGYTHLFVKLADLSGDGRPDLLSRSVADSYVHYLPGVAGGTFGASSTLTNLGTADSAAYADFDGDGILDMATPGGQLYSLGSSLNLSCATLAGGTGGGAAAAGDFDHDGHQDVAVLQPSLNQVKVLLRPGNRTVCSAVASVAVSSDARALAVGDANEDGKPDLLVGLPFGGIELHLGNGNGTFAAASTLPSAPLPSQLELLDLNQDGHKDLLAVSPALHTATLHLGNGDGSFQAGWSYALGGTPESLNVNDLNADGRPDLVSMSYVVGQTGQYRATLNVLSRTSCAP